MKPHLLYGKQDWIRSLPMENAWLHKHQHSAVVSSPGCGARILCARNPLVLPVPFSLSPLSTFTLTFSLLLCSFALSLPEAPQIAVSTVPQLCPLCSAPLWPFGSCNGRECSTFTWQLEDEQQIVQLIGLHRRRLSVGCSFEQRRGDMETRLARKLRTGLGGYLMAFLKFRKEQRSLCGAFLLLLCFPLHWFLLFCFLPPSLSFGSVLWAYAQAGIRLMR